MTTANITQNATTKTESQQPEQIPTKICDNSELQKLISQLLKTNKGLETLNSLIGGGLEREIQTAKSEKKHIPAKKRNVTFEPPYVLLVKHFCNLCNHKSSYLFKMIWNSDDRCYKSHKLENVVITDKNEHESYIRILETIEVKTQVNEQEPEVEDKTEQVEYPLQIRREQVATCPQCHAHLMELPKEELVHKLIIRVAKVESCLGTPNTLRHIIRDINEG